MKLAITLLIVIILDFIFGDPYGIPHPIIYIGKWIGFQEKLIRKSKINLYIGGFLLVIGSLIFPLFVLTVLIYLAGIIHPILKEIVTIYLLYTSIAAKCLKVEVFKVYNSLKENNIKEARKYISYLVGRDTTNLDKEEITRAAIETVAENTIDGVLAPLFYLIIGLVLGHPVQFVFFYKIVNTLDSMVGYKQDPYKEIGFCSAKFDDMLNFIPARIGSLFMVLGGGMLGLSIKQGFKILIRDRLNHKSPNCGYPESAVAGLLNIQIGGTNKYFNEIVVKPTIGDSINLISIEHIKKTTYIMYMSEIIMILVAIVVFVLFDLKV